MRHPAQSVRRGSRSTAALLTTLLPLVVSVFVWASESVAQESSYVTNSSISNQNLNVNNSDILSSEHTENKPVLHVNNPQLLREMQQQSFLRHNFRLSGGGDGEEDGENLLDGSIPLLKRATSLASHLRHIANNELGVTHMQATFDELPYSDLERKEAETVKEMMESLELKFTVFSNVLGEMSEVVLAHYIQRTQGGQDASSHYMDEPKYHPCCLISDHYLMYHSHFGTRVNEELWCDSGFGSGDYPLPADFYAPPFNLTEMFAINLRRYPVIKWQYFMSVGGLHTEYPAHRTGTSIGSDCGQSTRHRQVYEASVRPEGRNIVLLYDLGDTLTQRLLVTAKAIGHQIVSTLTRNDMISVIGAAGHTVHPAARCMTSTLVSATHDVQQAIRHFIDYMEIQNERTNHSHGLSTALDVISKMSSDSVVSANASVLLIYVSRGFVDLPGQVHSLLKNMAARMEQMVVRVVITTFGLGLVDGEPSLQRNFLEALAYQEFAKYNVAFTKGTNQGKVVTLDSTLSVAPFINNIYNSVNEPMAQANDHQDLFISEPYWDEDGRGMVVSLTRRVLTDEGKLIGIVGLDLPLSNLLEDITYFNSPAQSYAFAVDSRGNVLGHPKLGRPEAWAMPLIPADITLLEQSPGFGIVRDDLINLSSGHRYLTDQKPNGIKGDHLHYWWYRSPSCGWVFVLAWNDSGMPHKRLSRNVLPLPPSALFHRLDLLLPSEARVCRHFNQMATLDGSTVFLPFGSYVSLMNQAAVGPETLAAVQSITAYLSDATQLIANPGLRLGVRTDATAIYHISDLWQKQFHSSDLSKYIVRRYGATPSGVTLMYPGTLLDRTFDPRSQKWYLDAVASPGKVIVSAPYLDPGGAGHVITVSHTVYQGRSAVMHSPSDPVVAVLATDFTLGYWYKLLLDLDPACDTESNVKDSSSSVRCFLVDTEGYLVAHPAMLTPLASSNIGSDTPPHITRQEPVVSMELLAGGEGLLTKSSCGRWWHDASERHYSLHLPSSQVVSSSPVGNGQTDGSCLHYALTTVPATNLIFGIINQTCTPAVAFCPCSMDDRLCLNCQLVEAGACECPCECPLSSDPCNISSAKPALPNTYSPGSSDLDSSHKNDSNSQLWQSYAEGGSFSTLNVPRVLELTTQPPDLAPTCGRTPEAPVPLQYSIGLLDHLDFCVPISCAAHMTEKLCLGIVGCVWCSRAGSGDSLLMHPHCAEVHQCYGGILGGPSPYPHGLATLPHSDNTHGGSGSPIGPVAGGIMAVFLVVALAVYCYRQHVGGTGRSLYTPANFQARPLQHPLYQAEPVHEIDNGDEDLLGDVSGVGLGAAATISPYRMNPGYRRPPGQADSSDHGYSTMTPHDDSENLNYTDLGGLVGLSAHPAADSLDDPPSSTEWSPPSSPIHVEKNGGVLIDSDPVEASQTILSPRKHVGPNILIVPVTVHMVDSV